MFYAHYRRKRRARDTGKFNVELHRSSPKFQKKTYRDWVYQISFRKTGLTRRRTVYYTTIWGPDGAKGHYIANLRSVVAAQQQSEMWIDQRLKRHETASFNRETKMKQVAAKIRLRLDQNEKQSDSET